MAVTFDSDELTSYGDPECAAILYEVFSLHERYTALLKARRAVKLVELRAQHEAKIIERRKHGERLRVIETQGRELQATGQELTNAESDVSFQLRVLRGQQPNPGFALASEIAEHKRKEAALEKQLEKIEGQKFDLTGAQQTWQQQADEGDAQLGRLNLEVEGIFASIQELETGKKLVRHDRSTGLWTGRMESTMTMGKA